MDDGMGSIIGIVLVIAAVIFVVYVISIIAAVAATGGTLWGGGWAIVNYGKSFKENMIDSNRTVSAV